MRGVRGPRIDPWFAEIAVRNNMLLVNVADNDTGEILKQTLLQVSFQVVHIMSYSTSICEVSAWKRGYFRNKKLFGAFFQYGNLEK